MITRRTCLRLIASAAAALAAPAGCRGNERFRLTPGAVLADLRQNDVIGKLRDCQLTFRSKNIERLTERGKEALTIIQRGLITLDLLPTDPASLNFGVYGSQTASAVRTLLRPGEIEASGEEFDCQALKMLENALEAKVNGDWP